jgi:hypothetical protein
VLAPAANERSAPVEPLADRAPAVMRTSPPSVLSEVEADPAVIVTSPPEVCCPEPALTMIAPAPPLLFPCPVDIKIEPDVPELVVPVRKTRAPDIPSVPAFGVRMVTEPLDFRLLVPLESDTNPPVAPSADPPDA